MEVSKSKSRHS